MAQAPTRSSRPIPGNSDDMQSEIKKIRSEFEQKQKKEQQERKKLQDKVSKINEQQEAYRLVTTRLSAAEDSLKSISQAVTSKQKAPKAAWLKTSFETTVSGDETEPRVSGIVILPGGDIIILDSANSYLKYFNHQGCLLHKMRIGSGWCYLADLSGGRVALLNRCDKTLEIIMGTKCRYQTESSAQVQDEYNIFTALDQQTLGCCEAGTCKIDVLDLTGNCLWSIETSETVNLMSPSDDGSLVCKFPAGLLKVNLFSGSETWKKPGPVLGSTVGVATTKDCCIIVCDKKKRTFDLLSSTGDPIKTLWSFPRAQHFGHSWNIAVAGDVLLCCEYSQTKIFVLDLVY